MEASRVPPSAPAPEATVPGSAVVRVLRRWADGLPPEERGRAAFARTMASAVGDVEERIGPLLARPLREHGLEPLARHVERNPVATLAGAALAAWVARRLIR